MKLTWKEEDYLETIYRLSRGSDSVGITDVARERGVTLPTVTSAVSRLKENGLLTQRHYGKIFLSSAGKKLAAEVYRTHKAIRQFLTDVLGLPHDLAEDEACQMEHAMKEETISRLVDFVEAVKSCPTRDTICQGREFAGGRRRQMHRRKGGAIEGAPSLNDMKPGQTGTILGIAGRGPVRRRLLDLGIRAGEMIKMIKAAPLKDPLEISLHNGHLSIRRSEAALIAVEIESQT